MTELFSAVMIPFSRAITFLKPSVKRKSTKPFLPADLEIHTV